MTDRIHRRALLARAASVLLGLSAPVRRLFAAGGASETSLDEFLFTLLQRLFPHAGLDDSLYVEVAEAMAGVVDSDSELQALVAAGRRRLDDQGERPWLTLDAEEQVQRLAAIETTPFFQTLRGLGGFLFYDNPTVWPYFGYEGSSFEKGGYLHRGFDDLDWLPDPES